MQANRFERLLDGRRDRELGLGQPAQRQLRIHGAARLRERVLMGAPALLHRHRDGPPRVLAPDRRQQRRRRDARQRPIALATVVVRPLHTRRRVCPHPVQHGPGGTAAVKKSSARLMPRRVTPSPELPRESGQVQVSLMVSQRLQKAQEPAAVTRPTAAGHPVVCLWVRSRKHQVQLRFGRKFLGGFVLVRNPVRVPDERAEDAGICSGQQGAWSWRTAQHTVSKPSAHMNVSACHWQDIGVIDRQVGRPGCHRLVHRQDAITT
jgi:hypothetical protein